MSGMAKEICSEEIIRVDDSVLKTLARYLAGNEKKLRDQGLKKLRKWISSESRNAKGTFQYLELLRIWKALHYCMWMSDKPLVQEDLAEKLSKLVHSLRKPHQGLQFLRAFFEIMSREWLRIDQLRLDKFMMLVRLSLRQGLLVLKKRHWKKNIVEKFTSVLAEHVANGSNGDVPIGLKMHVADIYLNELHRTGASKVDSDVTLMFLKPYCQMLITLQIHNHVKSIIQRIFQEVITKVKEQQNTEDDNVEIEKKKRQFLVDPVKLADVLFKAGSDKACPSKNRKEIYSLVKRLQHVAGHTIELETSLNTPASDETQPSDSSKTRKRKAVSEDTPKVKKMKQDSPSVPSTSDSSKKSKQKKKQKLSPSNKQQQFTKLLSQSESSGASSDNVTDSNVHSGTSTKKHKKHKTPPKQLPGAKSSVSEESISTPDVNLASSQLSQGEQSLQDTSSSSTCKPKKRKSKELQTNEFKAQESVELKTDSASKQKTKRDKHATLSPKITSPTHEKKPEISPSSAVSGDAQEEVEIWIPNKKYTGKLKGVYEKQMSEKESKDSATSTLDSDPGREAFAQFEKLQKTPAAFVRRALAKTTPKSEPKKSKKHSPSAKKLPGSAPGSNKRVSFAMNQNQAQDYTSYKNGLDSPAAIFDPSNTPSQGILKPTSSSTSPNVSTPRQKLFQKKRRATAADFF